MRNVKYVEQELDIDMSIFPPLRISVGTKSYDYEAIKATYMDDGTIVIEYKRMPYFYQN